MLNAPHSAQTGVHTLTAALTSAQILIAGGKKEEAIALLADEMQREIIFDTKEENHVAVGVIATLVASKRVHQEYNQALRSIIDRLNEISRIDRQIRDEHALMKVLEDIEELKRASRE